MPKVRVTRPKQPPLGSGGRFKALTSKLEAKGHSAASAARIAARVGIKRHGRERMAKISAAGRKREQQRSR